VASWTKRPPSTIALLVWVEANTPITNIHDLHQPIAAYGTIPHTLQDKLRHDMALSS
jgi:hypothetical protein